MQGTVLFTDLRGFTSASEHLSAERVLDLINRHLEEIVDSVMSKGGTLVSYTGDGIMAVFGAPIEQPDHAQRALRLAGAIRTKGMEVTARWSDADLRRAIQDGVTPQGKHLDPLAMPWPYYHTLSDEDAIWENSTVIRGDVAEQISRLKEDVKGDILVAGSATLVQTLAQHDLVDEYRLMVFPVVLGTGLRLFGEGTPRIALIRRTRSSTCTGS